MIAAAIQASLADMSLEAKPQSAESNEETKEEGK